MLIGLAGAKRSGKNTAAQFIREEFGDEYEVNEWSFAALLKQSAAAAITGEVLEIDEAIEFCDLLKGDADFYLEIATPNGNGRKHDFSGRQFLQWYGTEAHRKIFGEDFWIDAVLNEIPRTTEVEWDRRIDVITDVRFPNEAEAVCDRAGKIITIKRSGYDYDDSHASEKPLPDDLVWATLENDGNLDDLRQKVRPHIQYAISLMSLEEIDPSTAIATIKEGLASG